MIALLRGRSGQAPAFADEGCEAGAVAGGGADPLHAFLQVVERGRHRDAQEAARSAPVRLESAARKVQSRTLHRTGPQFILWAVDL